MPALRPCLHRGCGRLVRGSSYCRIHAPVRPSPSSLRGLKRSPATRRRVLERDGHRCACCGSTKKLRVHHLRRVADGGSNEEWNLVVLCEACHLAEHRRAGAREVEEVGEDLLLLGEL